MNQTKKTSHCKRCGICSEVCPFKVIQVHDDTGAALNPDRRQLCVQCGQCMAVCPTAYIQVDGLSYDENFKELRSSGFGEEAFADFLATRRSVRNFDGRDVPREIIQKVLNAVQYAPFGSHPEKVSITVVDDRRIIEKALPGISRFLGHIPALLKNPVTSFFLRKTLSPEVFSTIKNHLSPLSEQGLFNLEKGDRISRGAPVIILFHSEKDAEARTANTLIDATYAMLQAHNLGLGATMVEVIPSAINQVKGLKALFQIPEDHDVIMSLILGYPKYRYRRSIARPVQKVNWID